MDQPVNTNDGGRDLTTPAEQALRPGEPESRTASTVKNLKFQKGLGAITTAGALSSAAFSAIRASLQAKQSLSTLTKSLKTSAQTFDAAGAALLAGQTFLKDTETFGLDSVDAVKTGEFFSATDLTQISGIAPGKAIAGTAAAVTLAIQLAKRKEKLVNMTQRFSISLSNFSVFGPIIKENYQRTAYPTPKEIGLPSSGALAIGGEAAKKDSTLKDKAKATVKGVISAMGKPTVWSRLITSETDLLKGYRLQPGFNALLNMVFADKKNQTSWSEPSTAYAAQSPYNKVTRTESGHIIELDDTPGAERVHTFHRSGSFIEMHPDGKVVYKSMNHGYTISMADQHVDVKGTCHIHCGGDANIHASGNINIHSDAKDEDAAKGKTNGVNVNVPNGTFSVHAKRIELRSKTDAILDGTKIDLRYAVLPGTPVWTTNGLAVRLNREAIKQDFPETEANITAKEIEHLGKLAKARADLIKDMVPQITKAAAGVMPTAAGVQLGLAIAKQAYTTLSMINLLQGGAFPSFPMSGGSDSAASATVAAIAAVNIPSFAFPALAPEQEPIDNPLANPLVYIAQTPAAVNYRTLLLDTPEEMSDAEQYQAHLETRHVLGDIPSVEPQLGGKKTTPATNIAAPSSLPLVNYLDRDTYRGNFSADPEQSLGGTSFTYGELVDSLARPDVANPDASSVS